MSPSVEILMLFFRNNKGFTIRYVALLLLAQPIEAISITQRYSDLVASIGDMKEVKKQVVTVIKLHAVLYMLQLLFRYNNHVFLPDLHKHVKMHVVNRVLKACENGCESVNDGEIMNHILTSTWDLCYIAHDILNRALPSTVAHSSGVLFLFSKDITLGLFSTCMSILVCVISMSYNQKNTEYVETQTRLEGDIVSNVKNISTRLHEIVEKNGQVHELEDFEWTEEAFRQYKQNRLRTTMGFNSILYTCVFVYIVGSHLICYRRLSKNKSFEYSKCIFQVLYLATKLYSLANELTEITRDIAHVRILDRFLNQFTPSKAKTRYVPFKADKGQISFEHVSFKYMSRTKQVLSRLHLTARPGQFTILMGKSGCGKTTLTRLLLGFYPFYDGTIRIDDVDIRQYDSSTLRKHIGYVNQTPVIKTGTIESNLLYGNDHIDPSTLHVRLVQMGWQSYFDTSYPDGIRTRVEQNGASLSGGQRQMIELVRVFLKDPFLYVLDEPTSSLNQALSKQVLDYLRDIKKTIIVITHDPFVKSYADVVHQL